MGKTVISITFLFLLNTIVFSQDIFTKKMQWKYKDSIDTITFANIDSIKQWAGTLNKFSHTQSEISCIKGNNTYILIVEVGFGLPLQLFYIFRENNSAWELRATSQARIMERIKIRIDNKNERIIFETESAPIGELQYCRLFENDR